MSIAASTDKSPSWQTEPCPSWCTWQPHGEDEHPDDRNHTSDVLRRALPLEVPAQTAAGHEPETLGAYLWQHVREVEPTIRIMKGEDPAAFTLTIEDAEAVAVLLQCLVNQARGRG